MNHKVGIIAGNFDVIHPGYIEMFKECSDLCERFVVLLHTDPSIERPETKLKPILSVEDRMKTILSIRYVSDVYIYSFEEELTQLIKSINPDVRFLGEDYRDREVFTGSELNIPIHYIGRDHGWSTTKFKKLITESTIKNTPKPWGEYQVIYESDDSKVKKLTIQPKQRLSYQYHTERQEVWIITKGILTIILDDEKIFRGVGQSVRIPKGRKHRAWNETDEVVEFIEVQTGDYFGEDDIIRIEDDYKRD